MLKSSLLAFLASISCVSAIAAPQPKVTPAPVLGAVYARQIASVSSSRSSTSKFTTTWGYYSGGTNTNGTLWAPITWTTEGNTLVSSGGHVRRCTFSSTSQYISSLSSYSYTTFDTVTSCYLFTTCSEGWLVAASTSFYCVRSQSVCKTDLLYETFGASDAMTWMYCDTTSTGASTITAMYKTKPGPMPATTPASTTSETSATAASSLPSQSTTTVPPPPKSNNTGVIAGSVVGGVAVLAIAGVGILFLLRRNRKKKQNTETAAQAQPFVPPGYHSEKPPAQYTEPYPQQYPQQYAQQPQQYNPHHSMVYSDHGDMRPPNSPTPVYTEGNHYRTELPANSLSPAPQTIPEHRQ